MKSKNLDSIMLIAIEGPTSDFDSILMDAIVLWKNATKLWFLFTNLEKYLLKAGQQMKLKTSNSKSFFSCF
jgi:hypothetical protein